MARTKKLARRTMELVIESVVDWTECDGCHKVAPLVIVDQDPRRYLQVDRAGWGQLTATAGSQDLCPECLARVTKNIGDKTK